MPVKITFTPNRSGQAAFGRSEGVYRELERRAQKVIDLAQRNAPEKTGEYKRSFRIERVRVRGAAAVRVVNDSPVAAIIEHGSRPHVIEAKNGKALFWEGARHPVKKVNHPGTPARHILRNALRAGGR
jgi:Bacteriophage HK97-gp10, putative tail-component